MGTGQVQYFKVKSCFKDRGFVIMSSVVIEAQSCICVCVDI